MGERNELWWVPSFELVTIKAPAAAIPSNPRGTIIRPRCRFFCASTG